MEKEMVLKVERFKARVISGLDMYANRTLQSAAYINLINKAVVSLLVVETFADISTKIQQDGVDVGIVSQWENGMVTICALSGETARLISTFEHKKRHTQAEAVKWFEAAYPEYISRYWTCDTFTRDDVLIIIENDPDITDLIVSTGTNAVDMANKFASEYGTQADAVVGAAIMDALSQVFSDWLRGQSED